MDLLYTHVRWHPGSLTSSSGSFMAWPPLSEYPFLTILCLEPASCHQFPAPPILFPPPYLPVLPSVLPFWTNFSLKKKKKKSLSVLLTPTTAVHNSLCRYFCVMALSACEIPWDFQREVPGSQGTFSKCWVEIWGKDSHADEWDNVGRVPASLGAQSL